MIPFLFLMEVVWANLAVLGTQPKIKNVMHNAKIKRKRRIRFRRPRIFSVRQTLYGLREDRVFKRYRLSSLAIFGLYHLVKDRLEPSTRRCKAVPGICKLLATLNFLAKGSFQYTASDVGGISQASFSRFLPIVLEAILFHIDKFLSWPKTPAEWIAVKQDFYKIAGFPNVLGAIDCTHVPYRPTDDMEEISRNRKNFYSMNMQVIVDAKGKIMNVCAAYPGSTHDAFILRNSSVFRDFEDQKLSGGCLIGDSGYPARSWLLTPISKPTRRQDFVYNKAHIASRAIIERTFGILKSRFRCLDKSGGTLLYSPHKVCQIFLTCCVLHNICLRHRLPTVVRRLNHPNTKLTNDGEEEIRGVAKVVRENVIRTYFAN